MKKKLVVGLGIVTAMVGIIYIGVSVYFMSHFLPNTIVNHIACGGKTPAYLQKKIADNAKDYHLMVTDRKENSFMLFGEDCSYEYVSSGEEENILKNQNHFGWVFALEKPKSYSLDTSVRFNEAQMEAMVGQLKIFDEEYIVVPENASIVLDKSSYELVEEVQGNQPIKEEIMNVIKEAFESQTPEILLDDHCYVAPEMTVSSREIADASEQIESYLNATIHYEIEGQDENFGKEQILQVLSMDENYQVTINEEAVANYVQYLASKYNTYADVRQFQTSSDDVIAIGGGDYGWVIKKTEEALQILSDLDGGQPVSREPVYEQRAVQSGLDDIGTTYVEIDYTKQHLWFYKEGELIVDTDIVSGNLSRHNGSVDGIFKIVYKEKNATLVGEDYESSVKYFMPFAYNIGIHDADWRSKFGGEIYKTSGSHGCINVPPKAAKKIFNHIEVGTPVIAYYREEVELTNHAAKMSNAYSYVEPEEEE